MKVYHLINAKYGLGDLKKRRLKISNIMELNDPFEMLSMDLSNPLLRKAINEAKRSMSVGSGVMCFSANWTNPVIWSHYADKHRGLCLGFDVPDHLLTKIIYSSKRRKEISEKMIMGNSTDFGPLLNLMKEIIATKYSSWKYEKEYRLYSNFEEKEADGNYYKNFDEDLKLRQVIVGAESSISRKKVEDALGVISVEVEVLKARAAFKTFRIIKNKSWM